MGMPGEFISLVAVLCIRTFAPWIFAPPTFAFALGVRVMVGKGGGGLKVLESQC